MTKAFETLKALLDQQGSLPEEQVVAVERELGAMTAEERLWLSVEQHNRMQRAGRTITVEQYVQATAILEKAAPGSPEYQEAERIVAAFESAA